MQEYSEDDLPVIIIMKLKNKQPNSKMHCEKPRKKGKNKL